MAGRWQKEFNRSFWQVARVRVCGRFPRRTGPSICSRSSAVAPCSRRRSSASAIPRFSSRRSSSGRPPKRTRVAPVSPDARSLLEPCPRGSAAAVAFAAMAVVTTRCCSFFPVIIMWLIRRHCLKRCERAVPVPQEGRLVTFGIQPTHAETGYGYITAGEEIAPGVREASSFIEKPTLEAATELAGIRSRVLELGHVSVLRRRLPR